MNFTKFVIASFSQNITGPLLLIIAVSVGVKGKLTNETVNYDKEINTQIIHTSLSSGELIRRQMKVK